MINITHHTIVIIKSAIKKVLLGNGEEGVEAFKKIIGFNDEMYPALFSEDDMLIAFSSELVRQNNIATVSSGDLESMGFKKDTDFTIAKQFPPFCKVSWLKIHSNLNGTFAQIKASDTGIIKTDVDAINSGIENIEKVLRDLYLMRRGKSTHKENGEVMETYCTGCGRGIVKVKAGCNVCPYCKKTTVTEKPDP